MEVIVINKKTSIVILLFMMLLITACKVMPTSTSDALDGTEWELMYIGKTTPIPGSRLTIAFEDGEVNGSAGCNRYSGNYQISGEKITLGMLAWTEMACMQPEGIMEQEQAYMAFLSEVVRFEIVDGQLVLAKAAQEQLIFNRK
jgi:heat shock protein HslJ